MSSTLTHVHANGSAKGMRPWLQTSVQQFFSGFNWDDRPVTMHSDAAPSIEPLSLTMRVSQFFNAIPWEGSRAIAAPAPVEAPLPSTPTADDLTLDDFSSLF